jgi:hypothetical protein
MIYWLFKRLLEVNVAFQPHSTVLETVFLVNIFYQGGSSLLPKKKWGYGRSGMNQIISNIIPKLKTNNKFSLHCNDVFNYYTTSIFRYQLTVLHI